MFRRLIALLRRVAPPHWLVAIALALAAGWASSAPVANPVAMQAQPMHGTGLIPGDCGQRGSDCEQLCSGACPAPQACAAGAKPSAWVADFGAARAQRLEPLGTVRHPIARASAFVVSPLHGRLRL